MEKKKLSDAEAHRQLGIYTPAAIGNYRRGAREVPTDLIQKWEKVFGEKLLEEAKTDVDTNVPRGKDTETHDPWAAVHKLIDAFTLTRQDHKDEVEELKRDKEFFKELLRGKFVGPDTPTHKTK